MVIDDSVSNVEWYALHTMQAEELVRDWHATWTSLLQSRILLTDSHPLATSNDISALLDTR